MQPSRAPAGTIGLGKAAAFYLALTFLWCGPLLRDPAHVAADAGDPLHLSWVMAFVGRQLLRAPLDLFQSNGFYPYPNSLSFSDHLLPEAIAGLPLNLLTGNAVLALNFVTALGLFSSALAGFVLVSRLLESPSAGLLFGTFVGFNSFMQSELLRVQVLQVQGFSLALLLLWRFSERPSWPASIALSSVLALQGLVGTYYAIYTALLAPFLVAAVYAGRGRRPSRGDILRLAVPAGAIGGSCLAFLWPYRAVAAGSLAQKPIANGADIASFLLPDPDFWLWQGWLPAPPRGESNHFLGYTALTLALLTLAAARTHIGQDSRRRFLALAAGAFIVIGALISIGGFPRFLGEPLGRGPYLALMQAVPFLRGMATVERAGVLVGLGVALLASLSAARILKGRPPAAAFALATLAAAEQWTRPGPGFPVPTGAEVPGAYRFLASESGPVVEVPVYPDRLLRFRSLYLYFSTYHWRPVPFGRASFYPPAHDYLATLLLGFPDDVSVAALRTLGIRDVLVHPFQWEEDRDARLAALAARGFEAVRSFSREESPSAKSLGLGGERLYRLGPAGQDRPRPCVPSEELPLDGWRLRSSARQGTERLRDRDPATFWSTVVSQKEGDFVALHAPAAVTLAAIRLDLGPAVSSFPTNLRVDLAGEGEDWVETPPLLPVDSATETLKELLASHPDPGLTIRLTPGAVRSVRLRLGHDPARPGWNPWAIAELRFFGACR